jgi:hypothetical protein
MKQTIVISIIVAFLFFTLGYFVHSNLTLSANQTSSGLKELAKGSNTFQAGWDAAKKRLAETNFIPMMDRGEVSSISGTVKAVNGNKITLTIRPLEPLADPALDERTITVDNNTKISGTEQKYPQILQKEMEDFQKNMQERINNKDLAAQPLDPPRSTYEKKEITLASIKTGDIITVIAKENIKDKKEFVATEISALIALTKVNTPAAATPPNIK